MKQQVLVCDVCRHQISQTGWSIAEESDAAGRLQLRIYRLEPEAKIHVCGQTCAQRRVGDFLQRGEHTPKA